MQGKFHARRALWGALASILLASCTRGDMVAEVPPAPNEPPPPIRVANDRADLVFTFRGTDGAFATATSIDEIPGPSRQTVVVTDLSMTPEERQAARYVYLSDLTTPREDGTYPVAVASRYAFEGGARGSSGEATEAQGDGGPVIVYSASWCGVCKRAMRFLASLQVPYVEKDIEASRGAAEELAQKAAAQGVQPSGVPVIDVRGRLLMGLDERTLRAALKSKGLL